MSLFTIQISGGLVAQVGDTDVLSAQRDLACMSKIVLVNTSSGVKNLEAVADLYDAPATRLE